MKTKTESVKVTISIDKDVKDTLEQVARELDSTMSKIARNLIYIALDDFKELEKVKLGRKMLSTNLNSFKATVEYYTNNLDDKEIDCSEFNLVQISVVMEKDIKEILEAKAQELNMPFKMLAVNMLYVGLREVNLFRKTGVLRLALAFQSFMKTFRDYGNKKEK